MSRINIVLTIIPTLYEGYIVSVRRMVMENRPVDPGSIQGSHRPISFIRIKRRTRAIDFFGKLSINNHIVGLVHKNHIIRTCLMCHAACKVEFQPFKRSYSQLTFFNFLSNISNFPTIQTVVLTADVFQLFLNFSRPHPGQPEVFPSHSQAGRIYPESSQAQHRSTDHCHRVSG